MAKTPLLGCRPRDDVGNAYVLYLTREGAHEGLFAMLWMPASGGKHESTGVIAPGPLPEPPEWVLPPAE